MSSETTSPARADSDTPLVDAMLRATPSNGDQKDLATLAKELERENAILRLDLRRAVEMGWSDICYRRGYNSGLEVSAKFIEAQAEKLREMKPKAGGS